jgi:MFS superfamily sulfate permease-like transporter
MSLQVRTPYLRPHTLLTLSGVTVGFVVIPQGMAYAILAKLPPEYGLYTSFVGFLLYWAFATSKDITIGVSTYHPYIFKLET